MYRTSTSSEPRKSIRVAEKQWKMTKEWQEKAGKEDTLFKDKLLEKKKKNCSFFQVEKQMEYTGIDTAIFALTLLYPNTWHWKEEPDNELEDPTQHHFPVALTTTEVQEIERILSLLVLSLMVLF